MRNSRARRCLALGLYLGTLWGLVGCGSSATTQSGATCTASGTGSGSTLSIAVSCSGGTAPYSVASVAVNGLTPTSLSGNSSFDSSTTLTFVNSSITSYDGLSGTVYVTDSASSVATPYTFTVGGTTVGTSTYCTLTPSTTTPTAGTQVTFTATASGWGSGSYSFSSFSPGSGGTVTTNLSAVSATQAYAAATYSSAGAATATVYVTDTTSGTQQSCSTTLTVSGSTSSSGTISCTLTSSSNPVAVGYGTLLTATIVGGSGTTYVSNIEYPLASGMQGYFTGNTTAYVGFAAAGSWTLRAIVRDQTGSAGSCSLVQQVQ